MTKIILFSFLGIICFLYTLNLFLRGAKKQLIEVSDHRGVARRIIFQTGKEFMATLDNLCYSACSERIGQAGHGR
ncbi:MAG: hypothetical protein WA121_04295, partial [Syntrophales bacterium]